MPKHITINADAAPDNEEKLMTTHEAADFFGMAPSTLEKWRVQAIGPTYVLIGRSVRYRLRDLLAFAEGRKVVTISAPGRRLATER